jgi:hypothetical protein
VINDFKTVKFETMVRLELEKAIKKFPQPLKSPHEGYAVILEELDELWEHVKRDTARGRPALDEAVQIAAMAFRYAYELCADDAFQ